MAVSEEYREYVRDLFTDFGPIRIRSMFGGAGIFRDDLMFGLIIEDQIYLKTDNHNRTDFEAAGQGPFLFERKDGRITAMSYYLIPDALYDDTGELSAWAQKAFAAAQRGATRGNKKIPASQK
jgi:DNA transformation protein